MLVSVVSIGLLCFIDLAGGTAYDIINSASLLCGLFHYVLILGSYLVLRRNFQVGIGLHI